MNMIVSAAAVSTATAVSATAEQPDPIFAAIEAHRKAMAACHAAVAVSANLSDGTPKHAAAQAITDRATAELDAAGENLAAIEPTTTAGLFAVLGHVIGCIEAADDDGLDGDRAPSSILRCSSCAPPKERLHSVGRPDDVLPI
jgi:hypothetical protein